MTPVDIGPASADPGNPTRITLSPELQAGYSITTVNYTGTPSGLFLEVVTTEPLDLRLETTLSSMPAGGVASVQVSVTDEFGNPPPSSFDESTWAYDARLQLIAPGTYQVIVSASASGVWTLEEVADLNGMTVEDLTELILSYYPSIEQFLSVYASSFPKPGDPGPIRVVLRFYQAQPEDYSWQPNVSYFTDFEDQPVGPGATPYTYITNARSHSGTRSVRQEYGGVVYPGLVSVGASPLTPGRPERATLRFWQYLNLAAALTPLFHINDYWRGVHGVLNPGALDVGTSINRNGLPAGIPTVPGSMYVTQHLLVRNERKSPAPIFWEDTGVSPWDRWVLHEWVLDLRERTLTLRLGDEGGWDYENTWSVDEYFGTGIVYGTLEYIFSRENRAIPDADHQDYVDDVFAERAVWRPDWPELFEITLEEPELDLRPKRFRAAFC